MILKACIECGIEYNDDELEKTTKGDMCWVCLDGYILHNHN